MKSAIFLVILAFVPFNLVYGADLLTTKYGIQSTWRPAFKNNVKTGFRDAHGKALGTKNFVAGTKHSLNHVYSWLSIRASVNDEVEAAYKAKLGVSSTKTELNQLADKIFEKDLKAVVNLDYFKKSPSSKSHISYLRSGSVTNTKDLEDLNKDMLIEAKLHIKNLDFTSTSKAVKNLNAKEIKELLQVLNSAPANLRYGESRTNGSIQDFIDLMGDKNGKPTTKETELVDLGLKSKSSTVRSIIKPETCSGVSCMKSSTGTILHPKTAKGYYYMRCQNLGKGIC